MKKKSTVKFFQLKFSLIIYFKFILLVLITSSFQNCSSSIRFASKDINQKKSLRVDSLRIVKSFLKSNDTLSTLADLEFTDEEIKESEKVIEAKTNFDITALLQRSRVEDSIHLTPTFQERFIMNIISYLGTPYKYGGTTRDGIDCSAFTKLIFQETLDFELPRNTLGQYQIGDAIKKKDDLQFGDLVFFNTRRRQNPGHVGIYLWDNLFAHSSTKNGVTISSMAEGYYDMKFIGAKRLNTLNHYGN